MLSFQAKHAWILLAFLLAWAAEQVLWVSTGGDEREACYEVFDAKGLRSATSAVVAALVVVALILGEGICCEYLARTPYLVWYLSLFRCYGSGSGFLDFVML